MNKFNLSNPLFLYFICASIRIFATVNSRSLIWSPCCCNLHSFLDEIQVFVHSHFLNNIGYLPLLATEVHFYIAFGYDIFHLWSILRNCVIQLDVSSLSLLSVLCFSVSVDGRCKILSRHLHSIWISVSDVSSSSSFLTIPLVFRSLVIIRQNNISVLIFALLQLSCSTLPIHFFKRAIALAISFFSLSSIAFSVISCRVFGYFLSSLFLL